MRRLTEADRDAILAGLERIAGRDRGAASSSSRPRSRTSTSTSRPRLTEPVGEPGRRLHTARSRNDQVATDFRSGCATRSTAPTPCSAAAGGAARPRRQHAGTVMPGFTHLQAAQPVTFGHHLLAYVEMLGPRPLALRRRAPAAQRVPARGRGAGRHQLPDRPGDDRARARLRPADGQLDRRRVRPRLRARLSGGGGDLRRAPVAASPRSWCCGRRRSSASSG